MCVVCAIDAGAEAAERILERVFAVHLTKGKDDPLDPEGFLRITGRVSRKLKRAAHPIEERAKTKAGAALDFDWRDHRRGADRALKEAADALTEANKRLLPELDIALKVSAPEIVGDTRRSVVQRYSLGISSATDARDDRVANFVRTSETMFVRDSSGKRVEAFSQTARDIVASGLERGLGNEEISGELATALETIGRPDSYWDLVANNFANRARNFTQIHSFDEAGIEQYLWSDVQDERECARCRYMASVGAFSVQSGVKRIAQTMSLDNPEDIANSMPWLQVGKNDDGEQSIFYTLSNGSRSYVATILEGGEGQRDVAGRFDDKIGGARGLERAGIQSPPCHAKCRCGLVPVV